MTKRERQKRAWFDAGIAALERALGEPPPGYVCPLCRRWFTSIEDVTFEHAPPRSLGGRAVALTCRACNSTSGHGIDAELRKVQDLREWQRGRLGRPLRARFTFQGIPLNADVDRTPDVVNVTGLPEYNDPANTAAWETAFARAADSGEPMGFRFPGFIERHARVALLRSAYVAAFARLGYLYALRPTLEVVRDQIARPDEELIERFSLHRHEVREARTVFWIERPRSLEAVAVQIDDHLVFLPGLKNDGAIYERLLERKRWPPSRTTLRSIKPTVFGWPTRPHHLLDEDTTSNAPGRG